MTITFHTGWVLVALLVIVPVLWMMIRGEQGACDFGPAFITLGCWFGALCLSIGLLL